MVAVSEPDGRVVVVSGGGTGIGRAVAAKFAALGWAVGIGGRRPAPLAETVALVEGGGGRALSHPLDVADARSVDAFFAAVEGELGPVAAVINNAASARYGPLEDFAPEEIEREVATKLIGGLYMARRAIISMRGAGVGGDILFVTSTAGVQPWPWHLPYAAANAGVEHAARTLRLELEGTGIRVNVLRCGETTDTDFATRELEGGRMAAASELWFRRGLLRHRGLMTPEMVAAAVAAAVTVPPGHQYEVLSVVPTAPLGELPRTLAEWGGPAPGPPPAPAEGGGGGGS